MEAIRLETTVGTGGTVNVPDVEAGQRVEVIVLKLPRGPVPRRQSGWMKGTIVIFPDFDDPIPGMEDYM